VVDDLLVKDPNEGIIREFNRVCEAIREGHIRCEEAV
jgi:hypothetical protein